MAVKDLNYDVALTSTDRLLTLKRPTVYTNDDNTVRLNFRITDLTESELTSATAQVLLYMRDGSFFQAGNTDVVKDGATFSYTLQGTEGKHKGVAQAQLVVTIGERDLASPKYEFKIESGLDNVVATEVMIRDWTRLTKEAREFIEEAKANEAKREEDFKAAQAARKTDYDALKEGIEQAEAGRVTAENTRQTNESTRQTNEDTRLANESERQAAEEERQQAETQRQAIPVRVARVEDDLRQTKDSLAGINVNQEPKQSVEDVDVVSLPKAAGNGQGEYQLEGLTATNIAENGDVSRDSNHDGLADGFSVGSGVVSTRIEGDTQYWVSEVNTHWNSRLHYAIPKLLNTVDKYYVSFVAKNINMALYYSQDLMPAKEIPEKTALSFIFTPTNNEGSYLQFRVAKENEESSVGNLKIINLTQDFGPGNEPSKELCDQIFKAYFEGTKHVVATGRLRSVGKNLFDGQLEVGSISSTTGEELNADGRTRSKNYTKVKPNITYVIKSDPKMTFRDFRIFFYTDQKEFITTEWFASGNERTFTTTANTSYVKIVNYANSDTDTNYQIEEGSTATEYEPYTESILTLPQVELRSLPNGVRDTVENGELVQRVSEDMEPLVEPIRRPLSTTGTLITQPSGMVYFEPIMADAGMYFGGFNVLHTDYPIHRIESIERVDFMTGAQIPLDTSKAVVAEDGLSFTHPDVQEADVVLVEYEYDKESIGRPLGIGYFDSRYTIKDDATGKYYKWSIKVSDGVPEIVLEAVE